MSQKIRFAFGQPNRAAILQFFTGSLSHSATRTNVAIGPSSNESRNQFKPLRFFPWASPALMRERVPQPTTYSGALVISGLAPV